MQNKTSQFCVTFMAIGLIASGGQEPAGSTFSSETTESHVRVSVLNKASVPYREKLSKDEMSLRWTASSNSLFGKGSQ